MKIIYKGTMIALLGVSISTSANIKIVNNLDHKVSFSLSTPSGNFSDTTTLEPNSAKDFAIPKEILLLGAEAFKLATSKEVACREVNAKKQIYSCELNNDEFFTTISFNTMVHPKTQTQMLVHTFRVEDKVVDGATYTINPIKCTQESIESCGFDAHCQKNLACFEVEVK